MFSFDDASLSISKDEILRYITHLQIFERYCTNYDGSSSKFKSEFYKDTKAGCKIVISSNGIPYYKDYGTGELLYSFEYVSKKFGSSYHETCNIIANDFNIKKNNLNIAPRLLLNTTDAKPVKIKSEITIVPQPFSIIDVNYWSSFGINLSTLQFFNVKACNHVFLKKGIDHYHFEYKKDNPIYSYRFYKNQTEYYKIYFPLTTTELKWLSNVGSDCLQGYDQLPEEGDLLILTKSLKDVMVYYEMNIPAVAVQAETNKISKKSFNELSKRFKRIVLNFDDDNQGRISTGDLLLEYDIEFFFIDDKFKDISDYTKDFGIETSKRYIKWKLGI